MKNNFDLKGYMQENKTGAYQQLNEMWYADMQALGQPIGMNYSTPINEETEELDEKGDVKSIGDAGKMAHANTRTNLGRHRSSDTLDKQVAKDHDKKTVVGDKAAAYKAPHMKEDDMMSDKDFVDANWDGDAETLDWEKDVEGKQVGSWTAGSEPQAGSIVWESPKYNALIYATPGWEGVDGIAVEMYELDADGYMDGEPMLQKVVGAGTDTWKTEEGYMSLMAKVFAVLEKALKPKQEVEEDHGTAVDHDKLDNISKDPSEFEDTVYEGVQDWNHTWEEDIMDLLDDGVSKPEILTHFKDILKNADSRMEESVEDQDPFGSIKTGIDKIAKDGEENINDEDRFYDMGGDQIKAGIESLIDDGFDFREIIDFVKQVIVANKRK